MRCSERTDRLGAYSQGWPAQQPIVDPRHTNHPCIFCGTSCSNGSRAIELNERPATYCNRVGDNADFSLSLAYDDRGSGVQ